MIADDWLKIFICSIFSLSELPDRLWGYNLSQLRHPFIVLNIIENTIARKKFSINSSIRVKNYILDKNEKKLLKDKNHILLTEKEIQLLELFLKYNKPLSKNKILDEVWKYSEEADTHTVETHIYRLRKKIKEKFLDEDFILNNKTGYLLWKKEIK